jgi:hypothetical protein
VAATEKAQQSSTIGYDLPPPMLPDADDEDNPHETLNISEISPSNLPTDDSKYLLVQQLKSPQDRSTGVDFEDLVQIDTIANHPSPTSATVEGQGVILARFPPFSFGFSESMPELVDIDFTSLPADWDLDFVGSQMSLPPDMSSMRGDMVETLENGVDWDIYDPDILNQSSNRARENDSTLDDDVLETKLEPEASRSNGENLNLLNSVAERSNLFHWLPEPGLEADSRETLMLFFQSHTCGILSIKEDPDTNLWRTLVWPLAKENPALNHAIYAMTCLHMSRKHPHLRLRGLEHIKQSRDQLAAHRRGGSMRLDAALATTLALGFAETWDHQRSSTGFEHIVEARSLVQESLTRLCNPQLPASEKDCLHFLVNTWVYMDVIARLTTMHKGTPIDFRFMEACINVTNDMGGPQIDPLMGCAVTLFPLIGRVADLVRCIWNGSAKRNSPVTVSQAVELMDAVKCWKPTANLGSSDDSASVISDSVQTGEAYRWATILLLHQAVPALPSFLSMPELAQKALVFIATIPLSSGTTVVQIFPLLVAGCEVVDEEERDWVRQRWGLMSKRMTTGIVDRCITVTEEVWRRRDQQQAPDQSSAQMQPHSTRDMGMAFSTDQRPDGLSEEQDEIPSGGSTVGKERQPSSNRQFSVGPTKPVGSMNPTEVSTKLRCASNTVNERLQWLGVMRDWNWQSEYHGPPLYSCQR